MDFSLNVGNVAVNLRKIADGSVPEIARAFNTRMELIATRSQELTPVDTGALRNSTQASVTVERGEIVGRLTVGGVAAPYAIPVHENLEAHHDVGQAKYAETAVNEAIPTLAADIAAEANIERLAR